MPSAAEAKKSRGWMTWVWLAIALAALVLAARQAMQTDWPAVWQAVRERSLWQLVAIAIGALLSHALYACLDVVGRRVVGHRLPVWRTWLTATVSYALNLNLGALVGGVASRFRLYSNQGVSAGDAGHVIATSMIGNWVGYAILLAALPMWGDIKALSHWIGPRGAWALSIGAGLAVAIVLLLCARRTRWQWRDKTLRFPPFSAALLQSLIAAANWALMGALIWYCLGATVAYPEALAALLVAAVVGAMTHVPGGWGVLDFVLVTMLAGQAPEHEILAAVLVYRAAYYLLPLAIAAVNYFVVSRGGERLTAGVGSRESG
jgi:uncharacterized membrane protein YbhN (UPF0104 family)